jgi:uncharacterized protein
MSFLTAEWRKLIMANYAVDKDFLKKYVPHKTELDLWNDTCYVSLVGFKFANVRLLGVPIPFHTNFEEVNLRFYVKYKEGNVWKRGTVFISEIVPKYAISFVANTLYNEAYSTMPMKYSWVETPNALQVEYAWRCKGAWQNIKVEAENQRLTMAEGSETEFITEHYWGYNRVNAEKTIEYQVTHPRWDYYNIKNYEVNVDFGLVYGENFKFLNQITPKSVFLSEGSGITVEGKKTIEGIK